MHKLDELRTIQSFIQAAQQGSFTAAAEMLGITPAGVSKNVSTLEKSLGVRLFNRTTRSLSLTEEGIQFAQQAQQAVDLLTQASECLKQSSSQPSGRVKISLPNVVGQMCVMPYLTEFWQRYPYIQLDLDYDNRIIDFVKDGFDLVIRGGQIHDSSLISRKLGMLSSCLVATPEYLARYGTPTCYQDLAQHQLIIRRFSNGKCIPWTFKQQDNSLVSIDLEQQRLITTDTDALLQATLQHLGIAQIARYSIQAEIEQGKLQLLLVDCHHSEQYDLVLQYPHRSFLAPRVKAVVEFLLEKVTKDKRFNP